MSKEEELRRIHRVADMLATAHAYERDRLGTLAIISDVLLLSCSVALLLLGFIQETVLIVLLGSRWHMFLNLFSAGAFLLGIVADRLEWKVRSQRHSHAFAAYLDSKFQSRDLLAMLELGESPSIEPFLTRYRNLGSSEIQIPERRFLQYKQAHKIKVLISKALDDRPGVYIPLIKLRIFLRDNLQSR